MPVLNDPSFDVIAFFSNLSERHIQDGLAGELGYSRTIAHVYIEGDGEN